jgi:hypothetical protein
MMPTLRVLFTPQRTDDGVETDVGLGWWIDRASGERYVHHPGHMQGAAP